MQLETRSFKRLRQEIEAESETNPEFCVRLVRSKEEQRLQRHSRWIYFLPIVHLLGCLASFVGLAIALLQNLGIVLSFILVADFPISIPAYALAWKHGVLAAIWIVVAGTLWWYLLSRAGEALLGRFLRRHSPNHKRAF